MLSSLKRLPSRAVAKRDRKDGPEEGSKTPGKNRGAGIYRAAREGAVHVRIEHIAQCKSASDASVLQRITHRGLQIIAVRRRRISTNADGTCRRIAPRGQRRLPFRGV